MQAAAESVPSPPTDLGQAPTLNRSASTKESVRKAIEAVSSIAGAGAGAGASAPDVPAFSAPPPPPPPPQQPSESAASHPTGSGSADLQRGMTRTLEMACAIEQRLPAPRTISSSAASSVSALQAPTSSSSAGTIAHGRGGAAGAGAAATSSSSTPTPTMTPASLASFFAGAAAAASSLGQGAGAAGISAPAAPGLVPSLRGTHPCSREAQALSELADELAKNSPSEEDLIFYISFESTKPSSPAERQRYNDIVGRLEDLLGTADRPAPLVEHFNRRVSRQHSFQDVFRALAEEAHGSRGTLMGLLTACRSALEPLLTMPGLGPPLLALFDSLSELLRQVTQIQKLNKHSERCAICLGLSQTLSKMRRMLAALVSHSAVDGHRSAMGVLITNIEHIRALVWAYILLQRRFQSSRRTSRREKKRSRKRGAAAMEQDEEEDDEDDNDDESGSASASASASSSQRRVNRPKKS